MTDTSLPDLLLCCVPSKEGPRSDQAAATKSLLAEIRIRQIPAKYWLNMREFPTPPFPVVSNGIAIWLTVDDAATKLYEALRAWLGVNAGGRVEVTLYKAPPVRCPLEASDIQFDITELSEETFSALFRRMTAGLASDPVEP